MDLSPSHAPAGMVDQGLDDDPSVTGTPCDPIDVPDKYEVLRCLERGGMSVVYLACDRQLDRLVALKFLDKANTADLERFRREARLTARLRSPSIVKVYEMDEFAGRVYIAMEYIDGGSLADAEMDHRNLVYTLREVAIALRHAHENGIIHRDIKPKNVLLDRQGRAYLTDFGLARDLLASADASLSVDGQVLGTPMCMPPEQARGELDAVDARSDIYSLGATMYYKLVGDWPFPGESVIDVLHAVLHDSPPKPRSLAAGIPATLEAIVLKCLEKDRKDRYRSVDELLDEFDRFLGQSPEPSASGFWLLRLVRTLGGMRAVPRGA